MNNNIFQKTVGERISECRKYAGASGMTQSDLARILGKSLSTIQKYESGDIDIPISVLFEISRVLGVSLSYLVGSQPLPKIGSLSDIMAFIIELNNKEEICCNIVSAKDVKNKNAVVLSFDSNDHTYNDIIQQFLKRLHDNTEALNASHIDYDTFEAWAEKTILKHQTEFLTDKDKENK